MNQVITQFFSNIETKEQPVLTDISSGRAFNGHELMALIDKTAAYLETQNVQPKDTFLCKADNNIETALLILASKRHGYCIGIVPSNFDEQGLVYWKNNLSASAVIDTLKNSDCDHQNSSTIDFRLEVLHQYEELQPQITDDNLPFIITFTSGTTGSQKAIFHKASSFINCAKQFNDDTQISEDDIFLNFMPMHYMAGIFNGIIAPLEKKASVVIAPSFSIATILNLHETINAHKVTSMWMSPSMLTMLMKLDRIGKNFSETLKNVFVGTGSLPKETAHKFKELYKLPALQSYGLSELLYVSVDRKDNWVPGTCGYPIKGVAISISEDGTAIIQSQYNYLGWMEDGEFKSSEIELKTNDLAQFDSKGRLQILGRHDDMIIRGGFNISPEAIEQKIKPLISSDFCVLSHPHDDLGHCIVLAVEGTSFDCDDLRFKCDEIIKSLGNISIDFVVAVKSIPRTATGKAKRKSLRQITLEIIGTK